MNVLAAVTDEMPDEKDERADDEDDNVSSKTYTGTNINVYNDMS